MVDLGVILAHVGAILVHFGVIWDAKLRPKSVLRHLVGPMAPPRGPKGPLGSPRVPFWLILGLFWEHFGG